MSSDESKRVSTANDPVLPDPVQPPGDRFIIGIVFGVLTFWLFAQSMFNIAPDIQKDINISNESLNLAISATALFSGCFIVVAGGLADKFGLMRFTYLGFILSIIGSLLLIIADGSAMLITGRIIQGLSGACIMPATLALLKVYYRGAQRQRALSFWSIGYWGGSGFCSLMGGAIATWFGWQWIFIISIIFSIAGMLLMRGVPEKKAPRTTGETRFDNLGVLLFVIFLLCLNLVITKGAAWGWSDIITLGLLVLCVISGILFYLTESVKKSAAFIDFSLFRNAPYSGATFSNFMLNAVAGTLLVTNTYVQEGRGFSPFQTGMLSIGYLIAVLVMIRVGEKILQWIGAKKPMIFGALMTGAGVALMSLTFLTDGVYISSVMAGFVLFGLGLGFYATPSTDTAISNAPSDKIGTASGVYKMTSSLGGAFGVAISASIYSAMKASGISVDISAMTALLVNVGFCILSVLAVWGMVPASAGKTEHSQ